MDQWWVKRIDLLAKIRDIGLDDAHVSTEIVLPHMIQDLSLRYNAVGVDNQVPKECELCR
jgi:hypothetical protein